MSRFYIFVLQIGIQTVSLFRKNEVFSPGGQHLQHQEQHIVLCQRQEDDLQNIQNKIRPVVDAGLNELFLIADNKTALVGVEIGHHCVGHEQQIDHIQMRDVRHFVHKHRIERQKRKSQRSYDQSNSDIGFSIESHMALDLLHIPAGQWRIEAVGHGRPHAQLHQGEHGQNIGEKAVEAQISLVQIVQEEHPGKQVDQDAAHLAQHGRGNISYGILCARHTGSPPGAFSVPVILSPAGEHTRPGSGSPHSGPRRSGHRSADRCGPETAPWRSSP